MFVGVIRIPAILFFIMWISAFREVSGSPKSKEWRENRKDTSCFERIYAFVITIWVAMWILVLAAPLIDSYGTNRGRMQLNLKAEKCVQEVEEALSESWMGCHRY